MFQMAIERIARRKRMVDSGNHVIDSERDTDDGQRTANQPCGFHEIKPLSLCYVDGQCALPRENSRILRVTGLSQTTGARSR